MHALDAPMAAHGLGEAFDVEGRGGNEVARVEGRFVGVFDALLHPDDGLDMGEARLAGIALVGEDPVDIGGSRISSRLDAAMAFLHRGFDDQLGFGGGPEIVGDIGFEGRLVALSASMESGPWATIFAAISLVFSGTLICASTSLAVVA